MNGENENVECFDVVIIGSGVGGLATALYLPEQLKVAVVSKGPLNENSTFMAQGGIAAALSREDSPELHEEDTLIAGHGLSLKEAVHVLAWEAPHIIEDLVSWGMPFDKSGENFHFALEGAHCKHRILHANGDATGESLWQTLYRQALNRGNIVFLPNMYALRILGTEEANGVVLMDESANVTKLLCSFLVVATGGVGNLYEFTSNPPSSTGDGIAMAYDVGADVTDMEFEQFHPTVFFSENPNHVFLISEAVRGAGAVLVNSYGELFMHNYDDRGDLAPRDVVGRAIHNEMKKCHSNHLYLDLRPVGLQRLRREFPMLLSRLQQEGFDPTKDLVPVAPGAHYTMGGIKTDLWGRTSVKGLYAVGECACNYVHGANRLASNSLLEGMLFAKRTAQSIAENSMHGFKSDSGGVLCIAKRDFPEYDEVIKVLKHGMQTNMGIERNGDRLNQFISELDELLELIHHSQICKQGLELLQKITVCTLMTRAALWREESRGAHFRSDFPEEDPMFKKHLVVNRRGQREINAEVVENHEW